MSKKFLIVSLLFFCVNAFSQEILENVYFHANKTKGEGISVVKSTQTVIGNCSYTNFEIEIQVTEKYHVCFWLCPSKHSDGSYTSYDILLDKKMVGKISPTHGDWQSIAMDGDISLPFDKGSHTLSVVGTIPDIPSVENVRLSTSQEQAAFDNSAYNSFKKGMTGKTELASKMNLIRQKIDTLSNQAKTLSFPLGPQNNPPYDADYKIHETIKYTFYKRVYFSLGQSINISTVIKNNFSHVIELFRENTPQYHSWSVLTMSSSPASINMTAPAPGYYFIRVRSILNATLGSCDLTINGETYEDVPVYSYGIRRDKDTNTQYISFTCHNSGGDPRMWIEEGNAPGQIRAFNDNFSGSSDFNWGNNCRIDRTYTNSSNAVLLSTSSSYNPNCYCDIYAHCVKSDIQTSSDNYIKSAPATNSYNCISWSGGIYTQFIWPPNVFTEYSNELNAFDKFYGFERYPGCSRFTRTGATAANCSVALWAIIHADGTREYTHATVRKGADNNAHGFAWESKCGNLHRIYHPEGATLYDYGQVVEYYRRTDIAPTVSLEEAIANGTAVVENVQFTEEEHNFVMSQIARIGESDYTEFQNLYRKWESVWNHSPYSNPKTIADCTEYRELLRICGTSSLFLYAIYEKLSEGSICATPLLEDLTLKDNKDILKDILENKAKKQYTESGIKIVRTIHSNAMSYVKELLKSQKNNDSKQLTRSGLTDDGISFSNSDTYEVVVSDGGVSIQFVLKEASRVSAIVMDLEGKVICEIVNNKVLPSNSYNYSCNLPNGVFLVVYTLNGNINVRKIVVK